MSSPQPSLPPPSEKGRNVVVVVAAIAGGAIVLAALIWVVGLAASDPEAEVAEPSPTAARSTSPTIDDKISAIVADAHSGRYFSNDFEDTYPDVQERGIVKGMMKTMERVGPATTDAALACMLSYFETERSFTDAVSGTRTELRRLGLKAATACVKYFA
jgi:hypothetical protein